MSFRIKEQARCAVIGYGSWATAIMKMLTTNEQITGWYISNPDVRENLLSKGYNPRYLRDVRFETGRLAVSDDINCVVRAAEIIVLAVPSAFIRDVLAPLDEPLEGKFIISAIKGIVPDDYSTVTEFMNKTYGVPFDRLGVLSGPCHSEEVALEKLSYLTMASKNPDNAEIICSKFCTDYININPSTDIYGAEYAAVLKNIYAVGAGIAVGLGYGDNFLSVLVSNAAMEMNRFLGESFAFERNTSASAYLGDLLVTCYSQFSRNRTLGAMLGKGYRISSALAEMKMVAEGYYASACIRQVNKRFGIPMPIADCVYRILYEEAPAGPEMKRLTEKLY